MATEKTNEQRIYHIYAGSYVDLFLGSAVSVACMQVANVFGTKARYLSSATINYADFRALNMGLAGLADSAEYIIHVNNRYLVQVVKNCQSWRSQGIVDQKAHPEQVEILLNHLDRLGTGYIDLMSRSGDRDEFMHRLIKLTKHFYHQAQMEMINQQTNDLDPKMFGEPTLVSVDDLPGSVLWKKPLSVTEFQKKMQKSRLRQKPDLKLVPLYHS